MRSHQAEVGDRHACDAIIDARSPSEFALDHIPGAINLPVLDDAERAIVGTLYAQESAFEGRRVGAGLVAANLARHLGGYLADKPKGWRPLVYCWRGGLRSGVMVYWLRQVGWDAHQLVGGYKRWRGHVIERIETLSPRLPLTVIAGPTGSAKTRVLQALERHGAQVLDLEACASHKGSVLGALPGVAQPSQKGFETRIAEVLKRLDPARPVFVEAESRKIGQLAVPLPLLARLRASPVIEIDAAPPQRLAYLLRDYAYLGSDRPALAASLARLRELHSNATIARWQGWAEAGALPVLFEELVRLHYDPLYARSQRTHFFAWDQRRRVAAGHLDDDGIDALAQRILAAS
ncbi:tRNA 2-selenouridine(34) synthase MnmH [Xylophilus sp.]|uniref:tRNA 2-selenouridine(34) synthase MnmH n=1 Tax=Xylophilus sp. TaxID=2653893 RepID=UPI0013BC6734|nr:tRNA 2-selenouridine(34) synthase MnmH [Xylophilus sp.]KAF1045509.1 MAG: tRNA 2-selenouridine synthase [Xylophilus sp.]